MGDSTSANPGSPCYITSRKTDSHQYNTVIPPAQHSFIPPPASTTCCASTRPVRSLYSLLALPLPCHIPSEYKYTHTSQPQSFFLHLPRKMEPIEGSETSAFKRQTPGKYPKENILHQTSISTCFGHHCAHHQEKKTVYYCIWCSALVVLAVVVCSWAVSCVHCVKVTVGRKLCALCEGYCGP